MIWDSRLIGTKCEKCINGRELVLGEYPNFPCCMCKDRPDRKQDKTYFQKDVESEDVRNLLDGESKKGTKVDF